MRISAMLGSAVVLATAAVVAAAQEYPSRMIRLVVPAEAGGSVDILSRLLAARLAERLGQPVVVENRSGASQMIGAEQVAKSAGDGYTLLTTTTTYVTTAAIRKSLPFDPVGDLAGVTLVGSGPFLLVVHPSLPVKTLAELIALATAKPGQLNFGSAGTGSIPHMATELFAAGAKIKIMHVPYKSLPPAVTNTVGGHVQLLIGSLPSVLPHVKANRLRALAVTSARRSGFVPDLPTVAEAGVAGYEAQQWWGLFAQGKTPKDVIARLNGEVNRILATEDMKARLAAEGAEPAPTSPDAFSAMVVAEIAKWKKVVNDLDIKLE